MHYLYIDKRQRIETGNQYPKKVERIIDEFNELGYKYDFAYFDQIEISFNYNKVEVMANGKDITQYTHILFGGHITRREYELKWIIVDLIDRYNAQNNSSKILVQNSKFIKKMPHYSKIMMAKICIDYGLPHLNTYYNSNGNYKDGQNPFGYPIIAKHYIGKNDIVKDKGEEKIKKNVFKLDKVADWSQERLRNKDLKNFFIQEFSDVGEDIRTFVSKGKVVGGWKRVAGTGFMTVTKGSTYIYYNNPSSDIVEICEKAATAWESDFMALDFIYKKGEPYILEFSMHPGFNAYENKCIEGEPVNIARTILDSF